MSINCDKDRKIELFCNGPVFKGAVSLIDDLPTENVSVGDVYSVLYTSMKKIDETTGELKTVLEQLNENYIYTGDEFIKFNDLVELIK